MKTITEHEFFEDAEGDFALLLDVVSFDDANEPVLLVSKFEDKAYLRRSPKDVHEIIGINPEVIDRVRQIDNLMVMECMGEKIVHSYEVPTALLEEDAKE